MAEPKIMELAQEYASAWSLVGGRFDDGTQLEEAKQIKEKLRARIEQLENRIALMTYDRDHLASENAGLREDGERLDWLESKSSYQHVVEITHMREDRSKLSVEVICQIKRQVEMRGWQDDLRSAIDAARGK